MGRKYNVESIPSHVRRCKDPNADEVSDEAQNPEGAVEDADEPEAEVVEKESGVRI